MSFTGILGTLNSTLGSILLGTAGGEDLQTTFTGSSSIFANLTHTSYFSVIGAYSTLENGTVVLSFNRDLTIDSVLLSPSTYTITGTSVVSVNQVFTVNSKTVALTTSGLTTGSYLVTVSPLVQDTTPTYLVGNLVSFSAHLPYKVRSIYTDHGPIVKPPLILQQGHQWSVQTTSSDFSGIVYQTTLDGEISATDTHLRVTSLVGFYGDPTQYSLRVDSEYCTITYALGTSFTISRGRKSSTAVTHSDLALVELLGAVTLDEVSLQGGNFDTSHVGLYLKLEGSTVNGGSYKILSVLSSTRVQVQASFRAPSSDPNNNSLLNSWTLYDPRIGFIANDPSDVVVRVNGSIVTVDQVIGLLGQVVLTKSPVHGDSVVLDYEWISDPTVEFRRLNSREFRLNGVIRRGSPLKIIYSTTLANDISSSDTTLTVSTLVGFSKGWFNYNDLVLKIDSDYLSVTDIVGTTIYVSRHSATAASHLSGVTVGFEVKVSRPYLYHTVLQSSTQASSRISKASGEATTINSTLTDPLTNFTTRLVHNGDYLVIDTGVNQGSYLLASVGSSSVTIIGTFPQSSQTTVQYRIPGRDDIRAVQTQPLLRDVFYRAYERRYTAALNNPALFRLNTPKNRIAYPSLTRKLSETSVTYDGNTLPEADLTAPWVRNGLGSASIVDENLVVIDTTSGPYPTGNPFYWTREVDLSFTNVYAATWRMRIDETVPDGVFTGVSIGWSDNCRAVVLGYLLDGTNQKLGFLKRGAGNTPSLISSWVGGLDSSGNATGNPIELEWSIYHSYRFLKDATGVINLFVDGEAIESLQITEDQLPLLEELDATFGQIQNIFFGSLSREATSQSTWQFVRYLVLPIDSTQSASFIDVSYGQPPPLTVLPENSSKPWTPVGYHGNESLVTLGSSVDLVLDSTSYTSSQPSLVGGDFRGFTRIEPLLSVSSNVVLDFDVSLRTYTHGITPNAVMVAIDDGKLLVQVSFFPTKGQPKVSYPGRSLPQEATPEPWTSLGGASAYMIGRTLRIEDSSVSDGRLFSISDLEPLSSDSRTFGPSFDYLAEFKCTVISFVEDGTPQHFCGVTTDVFDGSRTIGVMLNEDSSGNPLVSLHSDGIIVTVSLVPVSFSFNWKDGLPHTYRITKNTLGNLVTLFVDNTFVGSTSYTNFTSVTGTPVLSFGSFTQTSLYQSKSVVDWYYVNGWRGQPSSGVRHYVGIWKGFDSSSLLGYHLQTKASGLASTISNVITDLTADFISDSVQPGDDFIIDDGVNRGVYQISNTFPVTATTLYLETQLPQPGSTVSNYRIPQETDWTIDHTYQVLRDPTGFIGLFQDASSVPLIRVEYSYTTLPLSSVGLPSIINRGLPSISWGAFDSTNLSQTAWGFVHYAITTSPIEVSIVPPHQVSNQRNVMASPEHLFGVLAHAHTQYSTSSTGVPYPWKSYVTNSSVRAFTKLNEGTPPVPLSQTFSKSRIVTISSPPTGFGSSAFGSASFGIGSLPSRMITISASTESLYNNLEVVEKTSGEPNLLSAFSDEVSFTMTPNPVPISATLIGDSWISGTTVTS